MNYARQAPRGNLRTWLASSINELAIAWWTCTSYYFMFATNSRNEFLLIIPLVLGVPLFFWLTWRKPILAHVDPIVSTGVFLLMVSIVGSYLFNSEFYDLIGIGGNVGASVLLFVSLYIIVMKMDVDLRKLLVFQAIYIELLMPAVIQDSDMSWGRLEPRGMTMNYAAMMGLVAFFGALAARNWLVKGVLSLLPVYTMVMMQSRGSMMAAIFAVLIVIVCWVYENWSRKLFQQLGIAGIFIGIASVGAAMAGYSIFDYLGDTLNKLFMLDDSNRGMGSGASGRSDLWAAAYNLWLAHPLFGVGFKGHTQFMPDNMLAHNAFLGLLADNGLVGLAGYLMILIASIICLLRRGPRQLNLFGFRAAILFSYLLYGMIESRAFSFGNTYSVLLLLVAFDSAKFRVVGPVAMAAPHPAFVNAPAPQPRQIGQPAGIGR